MSDLLTPDERHRLDTAHDGADAIALAGVVRRLEDELADGKAFAYNMTPNRTPDDTKATLDEQLEFLRVQHQAEVERLRTALEYYAEPTHYPRQLTGEGGNTFRSPVLEDGGQRARAAIGKQC